MKKLNLLIKTKSKTQGINNILLTVLIGALAIVSATAPFWHIFFEKGNADGVFGFKSMRGFLYAFGSYFALFGISIYLIWLVSSIEKKRKLLKTISYLVAGLFLSVSIYYLLYIFIDTSNSPFPDYYYEIAFIISSLAASIITILLFIFFKNLTSKRQKFFEESKQFEVKALSFIEDINKSLVKKQL